MKKRMVAALLMASLAAAAIPAYAAEEQQKKDPQEKNMTLTTTVDSTYTLTIPQDTNITFGVTSTKLDGMLKVSGNVDVGKSVTVTAAANPLHNDSHDVDLPYMLKLEDAQDAFKTAVWSEGELRAGLTGADGGKEIQLFVGIDADDWKEAKAGAYTGSIVFTAKLN